MTDRGVVVGLSAGALFLLGVLVWFALRADERECKETGMHEVCQSWVPIYSGRGVWVNHCAHWERETCDD